MCPEPDNEVAVIGAGLSGLGIGIALQEAGFSDYVIYERASDIGGTWRDNTYPGAGVDIPAHAYQFSFALKPDWSRLFAKGPEIRAYINQVADRYGLRQRIRLNSDIQRREWNACTGLWELTVAGHTTTARFVISATGPYVEPKRPEIAGLETFAGAVIHTSRWDDDHDLTGERVAMIGTGASAVQIVPEIAPITQRLDVYQRTPIWVVPKFDPKIPHRMQRAFARWPATERFVYRVVTGLTEKLLVGAVLRFERPRTQRTVHFCTRLLRDVFYKRQIPDGHADLRARLIPDYGLGCKRPAISSTYLKTFLRDDVELITDPIADIVPTGIRTRDGRVRDVDTLILATGFHLAHEPESYAARAVRGRDGFDLETFYREHRARSYQGISMPGLPNHFMVFGPYGGTGGNWHNVPQAAGIHIVRVLREAQRRGAQVVEAREAPAEAWTAEMAERLDRSLIKLNRCETAHSFYIDRNGDIPFLRPTSGTQAFADHASFPLDDYTFAPSPDAHA